MSLPSVSKPIAYSAKIINVKKLTETVCEITIEKPDSSFHLPGQFISVKIADGGKPCYRAYSLMTDYKGNLQIVVKLFDGGRGSSYLFAREEGDCLEILYPVGYFVFPEILKRKLYFIATGTGIAPIIAMLESLPSPKDKIIKVIFGLRADEDIFYEERIESLRSDFFRF
jgi:ferredoxin-NADP reductase